MTIKYNKLFINNKFVDSCTGATFETVNPANGKVICNVASAQALDVDMAVKAAHQAFPKWKETPGGERRNLLNRIADLLEAEKEEFARIETLDSGKPFSACYNIDIPLVIDTYRYYAGWADKLTGEQIPVTSSSNHFAFTVREPVGVVGCIIPWNFPLLMLSWKLAPALCLGCTVIIKPSEKTPLSALKFADLLVRAKMPPGVVNIISGFGGIAGKELAIHPLVNKISFTGSTTTGKTIQSLLLENEGNLKRISLELGGKSALIVFPDCNVKEAVNTAMNGLFFNNGQCCIACSRVYVHKDCYEEFKHELVSLVSKRKIGDPNIKDIDNGPVVDSLQYNSVRNYIKKGIQENCPLLLGGLDPVKFNKCENVCNEDYDINNDELANGYFIQPTIFADVKESNTIAREEIFGPVMCLMSFSSEEEVINYANNSRYGLGAGICTNDINKAINVSKKLHSGTVYVNCWNVFNSALPFGGVKDSGIGRELGQHALQLFTEIKTVVIDIKK